LIAGQTWAVPARVRLAAVDLLAHLVGDGCQFRDEQWARAARRRGVIVIALAPDEGHTAAAYLGGAEIVGLLWYLLYLRPRIVRGTAGATRKQAAIVSTPGTGQCDTVTPLCTGRWPARKGRAAGSAVLFV
jgi:hypothetical protein